jgi:cytochrome oxidase assembly protein ShyY1
VNGWRFALSRTWLGYLGLVVAFAIACTFLSLWQLARREEARAAIELVETNWESAPLALDRALPELDSFDPATTWQPVVLTGRYLVDEQLLARGRPLDGNAGYDVLVPFRLDDGSVFIVDRGWIPSGDDPDAPDAVPPPPTGEVTVVARLKPGEPLIPGRGAPEGQVATINLPAIAELTGPDTYVGAYGLLDSEDPATAVRPTAAAKPVADEGPHLSYAFQWVVFGILAFIGLAWAIRREYRLRNEDDPAERERAEARRRRTQAKGPTDAEIEDALLDR